MEDCAFDLRTGLAAHMWLEDLKGCKDGRRQRLATQPASKARQELDDMIAKAAQMQKRIVEEIRRIGQSDKPARQRMSASDRRRRRKPS
jgi:hypothetical protein